MGCGVKACPIFNPLTLCVCSQCWRGPHRHLHRPGPAAAADEAGEGSGCFRCGLLLAAEPVPDDSDTGENSAPSFPWPLISLH